MIEYEPLTDREYEVLQLLVEGKTNPEIADELVISKSTVYTHVHHIFCKLEVTNRTEAAVVALKKGLMRRENQ